MGLAIDREQFREEEYVRFRERLEGSLLALRELLARPGFGVGPASLGAELELFLIDAAGRPLPRNEAVLAATLDPRVTVELDRFNLECNLRPARLAGRPFAALEREIREALAEVERAARTQEGRLAVIGILPTLRPEDLQSGNMSDFPRYRALSAALQRLRLEPFRMRIHGAEPLDVTCDDVTFEGANTSLQLHLRVDPQAFARTFNAVQMATAPALAVAGNSPTFLGHQLWEETRVALFKQAVDPRAEAGGPRREPRVSFGTDWVAEGAFELFAENVALHEPLLPVLSDEEPLVRLRAGAVPRLEELRLHQGTVWRWNRAIYDWAEGGHLRIEMRALPAGPSVVDMLANAAFLVGLALGLAPEADAWTRGFDFECAHRNFYRAAQEGLEAELLWPPAPGQAPVRATARELVLRHVPLAREGLARAGVAREEHEPLLAVIEARAASGQTGAAWQRSVLAALEPRLGRSGALAAMLERYLAGTASEAPVHRWPVAP